MMMFIALEYEMYEAVRKKKEFVVI